MIISKLLFVSSLALSIVLLIFEIKKRGFSSEKSVSRYIAFFSLLMVGVYFLISFANFNINETNEINREGNFGGLIGFLLTNQSYIYFGFTSFFFPLFFLYSGLGFILKINNKYFPLLLSLVSIILIPMFLGIFFDINFSGIYGDGAARFFSKYLGNAGLAIILGFLILISILLFSEFSPLPLLIEKLMMKIEGKKKDDDDNFETTGDIEETNDEAFSTSENNPSENKKERKKKEKKVTFKTTIDQKIDYKDLLNDDFKKSFLDALEDAPKVEIKADNDEIAQNIKTLEEKLKDFSVEGKVTNVTVGPVITTYEFEPAPGIKVNKITSLTDDLALAMKAKSIRVLGHIPGKSAVGIEIPNKTRVTVYLKNLMTEREFIDYTDPTSVVLGRDTENNPIFAQISNMPHLLIAGTTGSGKSVCINSIITSILFKAQPEEVRFLMVDPKRIELTTYNGVPHLERPVITDSNEAIMMLKELAQWMDIRYKAFAKLGVRDITEFNKKSDKKKPYIIVIIDEMADLMLTSSHEIETFIIRLAQMSRAVGIHLILATQRPSVNIITGSIKANFPIRISFKVPSKADSKTIIDTVGAEKLLGKGDMLYIPPQKGITVRAHGAFIKTDEATNIANLWAETYMIKLFENIVEDSSKFSKLIIENELVQCVSNPKNTPGCDYRAEEFAKQYAEELKIEESKLIEIILNTVYHIPIEESGLTSNFTKDANGSVIATDECDPLFDAARDYVVMKKSASTSMLQRHFGIGYPRAARILEQMEMAGIVGPQNGSKPREIRNDNNQEIR